MRRESRSTERRAPITPHAAGALVVAGFRVTVEDAPQRVFPIDAYAAAGCATAPAGSWVDAPDDAYVVGLKELPAEPAALRHTHVFFGHAYKGQRGAGELLGRFAAGGGALLDIEYLVDERGRRLVAFSYWAGYVGAALAVLWRAGALDVPLEPTDAEQLGRSLRAADVGDAYRAVVVGALGRAGSGARDALDRAGVSYSAWDVAETANLDRAALLDHDLLVNTVVSRGPGEPLVTTADFERPGRRTTLICDVTCDVESPWNLLPVYDAPTSWAEPFTRVRDGDLPVDLVAIDNLPSLVPLEASTRFSADLLPLLLDLPDPGPVWQRCRATYDDAVAALAAG
jgi:saccharopine dehydrogenase (NAD+, L-lysine-forming)